ncbi:MAG: hypothetical protein IKN54_01710 [Lachnospiraceae bacterium]|nr:hypothetical protein [Lachnospiraceae bacterium]
MEKKNLKPLDFNDFSDVTAFQHFLNENAFGYQFSFNDAQDILLNAARIDDIPNQLALDNGELWSHNSDVPGYNPAVFDRRVGKGIFIVRHLLKKTANSFIIEELKNHYETILKEVDNQKILATGSPESYLERLSDFASIITNQDNISETTKIKHLKNLVTKDMLKNKNLTKKNFYEPANIIIQTCIDSCENHIFDSFLYKFHSCVPQKKIVSISNNALLNYAQKALNNFSYSEKLVLRKCFKTKKLDSQEKFVDFLHRKLDFMNKHVTQNKKNKKEIEIERSL